MTGPAVEQPTAQLLADLERRGIRLQLVGDRIVLEGPGDVLQDEDREAVQAQKPQLVALLRERRLWLVATLGRVPLHSYRYVAELAVSWWAETLFLVPGVRHARELEASGVSRGRIWTVAEVLDLFAIGVGPQDAQRIAEAKLLVAGAIAGARADVCTPPAWALAAEARWGPWRP